MDSTRFWTESIKSSSRGESILRILAAAIQAVDPQSAVNRHVTRQADHLTIGSHEYFLDDYERIWVVGAGKAGAPMASAIVNLLPDRVTGGVVVIKEGYGFPAGSPNLDETSIQTQAPNEQILSGQVHLLQAGHPLPDRRGVNAASEIAQLLRKTRAKDLVICVISGGGSALNILPAEGLDLEDIKQTTGALLASGADIQEFNTVRKHLEGLKGGQLARLAAPSPLATLILSDVVGDPLDVIASGPTVPDPTTFADALAVLQKYHLVDEVPQNVRNHLQAGMRGEIPDTPKPGDPIFDSVKNLLIGSNRLAAQAAVDRALVEGFHAQLLTTYLQGEANQAGRFMAAIARQIARSDEPIPRPACLVAGGETTVILQGKGKGGRNQELALGAVNDLAGLHDVLLVSLATDGGDGPTDAAGAVVTGETLERARQRHLEPAQHLAQNNAYPFFESLGDLLITGPTHTNVNDMIFLFAC